MPFGRSDNDFRRNLWHILKMTDVSKNSISRTSPGISHQRTSVSKFIKAPPELVYEAFLDADSVGVWLAPSNMKAQVHWFDAREGGGFRMSLTYQDAHPMAGKTTADTDTFEVRFIKLIRCEKIVQVAVFESRDQAFAGEMQMTATFARTGNGTHLTLVCDNIPAGIRPEDNEQGCRESLHKLAELLEPRYRPE